jgi:hypothetical protein
LSLALAATCLSGPAFAAPADLIVKDAKIYTVDTARPEAEAMAVADGKIVYVGDTAGAMALAGPATKVEDLGGRRVLPGLPALNPAEAITEVSGTKVLATWFMGRKVYAAQ